MSIDAYIVNTFLNSPLRSFVLGNDMGVGKTLIFETVFHARAVQQQLEHREGRAPKGQTYHPHLVVTQPILQDQSCADFLKAFKGIRTYYIFNSTGKSNLSGMKDVSVFHSDEDWDFLMRMVYEDRHDPEVSTSPRPSPLNQSCSRGPSYLHSLLTCV